MRQLHQKLRLQHHRHTGRVLQHKHTSYHGLAVVLLCAGIAMVGITRAGRAAADSLYVYARIAAPVPVDPAIIIPPPSDKTVTANANLTISGSCPVVSPRVVIVLLDNDKVPGSFACDSDNNFHIAITLIEGKNVLVARSYTITGDAGPDSAPVTVFYHRPAPPPSAPGTSSPSGTGSGASGSRPAQLSPLVLTTDKPFIVFGPLQNAVWLGSVSGGKPPYKLTVGWGDGTTDTHRLGRAGQQNFQHRYRLMQPYDITVQVRDAAGQIVTRHYAAVTPYVPPAAGLFSTPPKPLWNGSGIFGIYGAYLLVLAGFGWLWVRAHPFAYAAVPARRRHTAAHRTTSRRR